MAAIDSKLRCSNEMLWLIRRGCVSGTLAVCSGLQPRLLHQAATSAPCPAQLRETIAFFCKKLAMPAAAMATLLRAWPYVLGYDAALLRHRREALQAGLNISKQPQLLGWIADTLHKCPASAANCAAAPPCQRRPCR